MLVLTRKRNERIVLEIGGGKTAVLTVCCLDGGKVRLGIEAPAEVTVLRQELTLAGEIETTGEGKGVPRT